MRHTTGHQMLQLNLRVRLHCKSNFVTHIAHCPAHLGAVYNIQTLLRVQTNDSTDSDCLDSDACPGSSYLMFTLSTDAFQAAVLSSGPILLTTDGMTIAMCSSRLTQSSSLLQKLHLAHVVQSIPSQGSCLAKLFGLIVLQSLLPTA